MPARTCAQAGQTCLHIAALWGNTEVCEVLLAAGAELNAPNKIHGDTPAHVAGRSPKPEAGRLACAQLMAAKGADLALKNDEGWLAWQIALEQGSARLAEALCPHAHLAQLRAHFQLERERTARDDMDS